MKKFRIRLYVVDQIEHLRSVVTDALNSLDRAHRTLDDPDGVQENQKHRNRGDVARCESPHPVNPAGAGIELI